MGVGPAHELVGYNTIIDELALQGVTQSRAISLDLRNVDSPDGAVIFGGIDTLKYTGPLEKCPIIPAADSPDDYDRYWIYMAAVGITKPGEAAKTYAPSSTDPKGQPVFLDSGGTLTRLPTSLFNAIIADFPGATQDGTSGLYTVDCSLSSQPGTVDFTFGSTVIHVSYDDFIWHIGGQCYIGVAADDTAPVLGDTFLRAAYVVYDQDNQNLLLANAASCGTNLVAIGRGTDAVPSITGACSGVSSTSSASATPSAHASSSSSISSTESIPTSNSTLFSYSSTLSTISISSPSSSTISSFSSPISVATVVMPTSSELTTYSTSVSKTTSTVSSVSSSSTFSATATAMGSSTRSTLYTSSTSAKASGIHFNTTSIKPSSPSIGSTAPSSLSGGILSSKEAVQSTSTSKENYSTSTLYTTSVYTVTSCASTITGCPAKIGQITTEIIGLYTTICPITKAVPTTTTNSTFPPTAKAWTISTVYTTTTYIVSSCAHTVTNCVYGAQTTETMSLYTTAFSINGVATPVGSFSYTTITSYGTVTSKVIKPASSLKSISTSYETKTILPTTVVSTSVSASINKISAMKTLYTTFTVLPPTSVTTSMTSGTSLTVPVRLVSSTVPMNSTSTIKPSGSDTVSVYATVEASPTLQYFTGIAGPGTNVNMLAVGFVILGWLFIL